MKPLKPLFDSFWRAVAYCFRPDVLIFLLVPWVVVTAITLGWCYFYWAKALIVMQSWLGASESVNFILHWLNNSGLNLQKTLPSLVLIFIMIPLVMMATLLFMGHVATPLLVDLVRVRRFVKLEAKRNTSLLHHAGWSVWHTIQLLLALALAAPVSILLPPAGFLIMPVLGGWFTARILSFSVLVQHTTKAERQTIMAEHDIPFATMGVVGGYLSLAPSLMGIAMAWLFSDVMVWVPSAIGCYVLIVGFSILWFTHYSLPILQKMRNDQKAKQDAELEKKAKEKVALDAMNAAEANRKIAMNNALQELSKPAPPKLTGWKKFMASFKSKKPDPNKLAAEEIAKKAKAKVALEALEATDAAQKAALDSAKASIPKPAPKLTWWQKLGADLAKLVHKK